MTLAIVEPVELFIADITNETRLVEVGVDVVVELVLPTHRFLADVAKESGTAKKDIKYYFLKCKLTRDFEIFQQNKPSEKRTRT